MSARSLGAFVVMLSLTAPPFVGLACAWACTGHSAQVAGHNHGDMDVADVQMTGQHACSHDFPTVELYGPATERLQAERDGAVAVGPFAVRVTLPDQHLTVGGWSPPDNRALSPPCRSLVLRI